MKNFINLIIWFTTNKRNLPWRNTVDPYHIWISEIMLQQTRVEQGIGYYRRFIEQFPDLKSLALATETEVLNLWQGLGYYSRARNLHYTAGYILKVHNGNFPSEYNALLKLKGIGKYTAAAIASIAFNLPYAAVDGNVMRVLSRYFGIAEPINSTKGAAIIQSLADEVLVKNNPGNHNQAMMELGALVCTPANTRCNECVLNLSCLAYLNNMVNQFPVKTSKVKVKYRYINYFLVNYKHNILIRKRIANDIWLNLFELFFVETNKVENDNVLINIALGKLSNGDPIVLKNLTQKYDKTHKLTHQHLYTKFYALELSKQINIDDYIWISAKDFSKYPFPVMIQNLLKSEFSK